MYLEKLYKELGAEKNFDKAAIAAMVYETIASNNCGMTGENQDAVIEELTKGLEERYQFDIMRLAASWSNDLNDILIEHLGLKTKSMFQSYIWPYIQENEVVPGVKMKS